MPEDAQDRRIEYLNTYAAMEAARHTAEGLEEINREQVRLLREDGLIGPSDGDSMTEYDAVAREHAGLRLSRH